MSFQPSWNRLVGILLLLAQMHAFPQFHHVQRFQRGIPFDSNHDLHSCFISSSSSTSVRLFLSFEPPRKRIWDRTDIPQSISISTPSSSSSSKANNLKRSTYFQPKLTAPYLRDRNAKTGNNDYNRIMMNGKDDKDNMDIKKDPFIQSKSEPQPGLEFKSKKVDSSLMETKTATSTATATSTSTSNNYYESMKRYQNRAVIMEDAFQTKIKELTTMTRRVEILQDIVKKLNVNQTSLTLQIKQIQTQLTQNKEQLQMECETKKQIQRQMENQTIALRSQLTKEQTKCSEFQKTIQSMTQDMNMQKNLILQLERKQQTLSKLPKQPKPPNIPPPPTTTTQKEDENEILQLQNQMMHLSEQLEQLQGIVTNTTTQIRTMNNSTTIPSNTAMATATATLVDTLKSPAKKNNSKKDNVIDNKDNIAIAISAVKASEEREKMLHNRIRIIQHELQLVLTEKDDLETERNQALESNTNMQNQIISLTATLEQTKSSHQIQLEGAEKRLETMQHLVMELEKEREEWKETLFMEQQQQNYVKRQKQQARTRLDLSKKKEDEQWDSEKQQFNVEWTQRDHEDDNDYDYDYDGSSQNIIRNRMSNNEGIINDTNDYEIDIHDNVDHTFDNLRSNVKKGRFRRIWKRVISPKSWFRSIIQ